MNREGQGESQPTEGVVSLDSLASAMGGEEETALDASADSEEGDESEEVELEGDESEGSEEGEEEGEELTFTIKVDGKDVTLTQSELIERAQKGHDYTQKTMALAEERKALEPIRKQAEELRQRQEAATNEAITRLEAFSKTLEADIGQPPPLEWAQKDPGYYLAAKEAHETKKAQLQKALGEVRHLKDEAHRQRQALIDQKAEATYKHLADSLPGWNEAVALELSRYIQDAGIKPETHTDAFVEHGLWELAHKAKAYDALMAEKAKLKPVNQLSKVHKPTGSNQPPQLARRQEAMKAHKAKPSLDSLASLLS